MVRFSHSCKQPHCHYLTLEPLNTAVIATTQVYTNLYQHGLQSFTLSTQVHILPTRAEPANPQRPPTLNKNIHTTTKHTQLFWLFTSMVKHLNNFALI